MILFLKSTAKIILLKYFININYYFMSTNKYSGTKRVRDEEEEEYDSMKMPASWRGFAMFGRGYPVDDDVESLDTSFFKRARPNSWNNSNKNSRSNRTVDDSSDSSVDSGVEESESTSDESMSNSGSESEVEESSSESSSENSSFDDSNESDSSSESSYESAKETLPRIASYASDSVYFLFPMNNFVTVFYDPTLRHKNLILHLTNNISMSWDCEDEEAQQVCSYLQSLLQ